MKQDPNINELLSSYLDGELTQRQVTEIQRLISHDDHVADRLRRLQQCKMLVSSLPRAQAPAEMAEEIKASLERRTLLPEPAEYMQDRLGARHLLARKVLSAAAMIGLVAGLAVLVYTIVAPESTMEKTFVAEPVQLAPDVVATRKKPFTPEVPVFAGFTGRLELKTKRFVEVDAFIKRVIDDNGLVAAQGPANSQARGVYFVSCSSKQLAVVMDDLEIVWPHFDSTTLYVHTDQPANQTAVSAISPTQIAEITSQDSLQQRIKLAKYIAVLNDTANWMPAKQILAAQGKVLPDLIAIPKPVLTSNHKKPKKSRQTKEEQVRLTIIVEASE